MITAEEVREPQSSALSAPFPSYQEGEELVSHHCDSTAHSLLPSSKIPFRPRKVRKVSSPEDAKQHNKLVPVRARRSHASPSPMLRPLSYDGEVSLAVRHLRSCDPLLARVIDGHDPPIFHNLDRPFHSLTRSILYQQLAFKASASIYSRFLALCGGADGVIPEAVLSLSAHQLRQIGVSARKASYLHDLASKYTRGILSDDSIVAMDDRSLFTMLTMVKGIGAWSVHMFMIFSLHRPDVLPINDLGIRKGVQLLYGLDELPRPSQLDTLCSSWRPYRSVASWYMWRHVEAKGASMASFAAGQQQQPHQLPQPLLLDPVNAFASID